MLAQLAAHRGGSNVRVDWRRVQGFVLRAAEEEGIRLDEAEPWASLNFGSFLPEDKERVMARAARLQQEMIAREVALEEQWQLGVTSDVIATHRRAPWNLKVLMAWLGVCGTYLVAAVVLCVVCLAAAWAGMNLGRMLALLMQ